MLDDPLSPTPETIRAIGRAALDRIVDYYGSLAARPVLIPTTAQTLREALTEPLPQHPADFDALLVTLEDVIVRYSRHNAHPRFFGYISSPGTPIATIGSLIESALNINVTCWRSGPAATELEHVTVDWLKEMLGYPRESLGLLVGGGSMANFAGLAAARSAKAPGNIVRDGVAAVGRAMCVYVSAEGHFSITKAAGMLGIGESNVRQVAVDGAQRMDLADLERQIEKDRAAGALPFCVVANAGTTATGAFDPIAEIAAIARRYNLWLHVDAAYGGFAALAPSARHLFARIGDADSVALDPHKWLFHPVGCGCILYKDADAARAAFSHGAEYTRTIGFQQDEAFAFWDYGPELSRPFRALDLWLLIKYVGANRLGEAIEQNIACARYLKELIEPRGDFEFLAQGLSVFAFRYTPRGYAGDLDALNEKLLVKLQRGGHSYVSNAKVNGKFALRGCIVNYRTTPEDMQTLLEDVIQSGAGL